MRCVVKKSSIKLDSLDSHNFVTLLAELPKGIFRPLRKYFTDFFKEIIYLYTPNRLIRCQSCMIYEGIVSVAKTKTYAQHSVNIPCIVVVICAEVSRDVADCHDQIGFRSHLIRPPF